MKVISQTLKFECHGKLPVLQADSRMKDDNATVATLAWQFIKTYGVLLFRGFDFSRDDFVKWSDSLTGSHSNLRFAPDSTAVYGPRIGLHTEDSMLAAIPAWIWFYAVAPSQSGGETILCDGAGVVSLLGPTASSVLNRDVLYWWKTSTLGQHFLPSGITDPPGVERNYSGPTYQEKEDGFEYMATCRPIIRNRMTGGLVFANPILYFDDYADDGSIPAVNGPLRVRTVDKKPLPSNLLAQLRSITLALSLRIRLEAREFLWLDNTRFLHGRGSFKGERSILVKKAYEKTQFSSTPL